ncbi:hypothetical protein OIE43_16345 [Streptomyces pseudovenezuelae]|uniref:hypothetical protein n=1 Tax=Streptomyces pseudovenezuelae TaxID=67350 RepID=UPI002E329384|nr:hypothetical protein [Streptomyces pseudovenezuelae]
MSWSALSPGATVRVLRAVVGRRALQVGLLVGGLFVLGFLCGEQAQAADGIGALPGGTVGRLVNSPAEPTAAPTGAAALTAAATAPGTDRDRDKAADTATDTATATGSAPRPVVPGPGPEPRPGTVPQQGHVVPEPGSDVLTHPVGDKVLRPVTEDVLGAVVSGVVQPVGDLVETVTTGLTEAVGIPTRPTLPEWPTLPSLPETPSWPTLPTLPTVPGVPTVPGLPGTSGQTLPTPVTSPSHPQQGDHAARKAAGDEGRADAGAWFGPRFAGHRTDTETVARHSAQSAGATSHAPAHQAPTDSTGGALGGKSAVDNGSSRHGDAHAVTLDHRAPLRLVPGAAARVDAAGTRDRHRDIPVFPG